MIKTNSSHRFDQTGLLGFRDFSLPLNVFPALSVGPISVYLQYPAKVAGVSMERRLICTSFRAVRSFCNGPFYSNVLSALAFG